MGGIGSGSEKSLYEGLAETADRKVRPTAAATRRGDDMIAVERYVKKRETGKP